MYIYINKENKTQSVKKMGRDSSFLINDIQGASPKQQIPINVTRENFNNSSFIEPRPEFYRSVKKISDPLKHNDI